MLTALAERYGLTPTRWGPGWQLDLPPRGDLFAKVEIAPQALEWHVTAFDLATGRPVWTDWMDYLGYDNSAEEKLVADKHRDIAWFVGQWCTATTARVTSPSWLVAFFRSPALEWDQGGNWQPAQMHDPER